MANICGSREGHAHRGRRKTYTRLGGGKVEEFHPAIRKCSRFSGIGVPEPEVWEKKFARGSSFKAGRRLPLEGDPRLPATTTIAR